MAPNQSLQVKPRRRSRSQWQQDLDSHLGDTGPSLATAMASRSPSPMVVDVKSSTMSKIPEGSRSGNRRGLNWKQFVARRPWTAPLAILAVFVALYAVNPSESNPVHPFIFLSYKQPVSSDATVQKAPLYGKGPKDMAFVAFYTILLTFTREFTMQQLLLPLSQVVGIPSRSKRLRFMEQMYTALYPCLFAIPLGLWVMRYSVPELWYFNTTAMYEGYPHKAQVAAAKAYYLVQAAFWCQQALVMALGLEKPRKDFRELMAHHVVTVVLIALSYRFHFTYVGISVYITHDISEMFLAFCKSLNYTNSRAVTPSFIVSVSAWVYTRHYLNLRILASLVTEFRTVGPYEMDWAAGQYKSPLSNVITFALLAALQGLNLFWLGCLLRSAYRLAVLKIAKDDRSEDEEEEEEEEGVKEE